MHSCKVRCCYVVLIVALAVATSGCSWITSFIVLNYSANALWVEYSVGGTDLYPHADPDSCQLGLHAPEVMPARSVKKGLPVDKMKPAKEFTLDRSTCTLRVHLQANQGVMVWQVSGFDEGYPIGVHRLILEDGDGVLQYQGTSLARVFQRRSRGLYVFPYGNK